MNATNDDNLFIYKDDAGYVCCIDISNTKLIQFKWGDFQTGEGFIVIIDRDVPSGKLGIKLEGQTAMDFIMFYCNVKGIAPTFIPNL